MTVDTFRKILDLVDCVADEGLWLSCLHEPTLHPKLNDFLAEIPAPARKKAWFTTNLTRPLGEEFFTTWAQSGLHHINVSLDSLNPELFAVLRKFGRFEVFSQNLDRMTEVFRRYPEAPKLRFITMAFRSNLDEIPKIIHHSHERWLSSENEIRYTLNFQHIADSFRKEHYLRKTDWPSLTEKLSKLPHNYTIVYPPDGYEELILPSYNFEALTPAGPQSGRRLKRPLGLRARPDGRIIIVDNGAQYGVDIRTLADPVQFFQSL
jgi:uncharacterized Fe-S cluster-containing radical SAM superfamily enzyme